MIKPNGVPNPSNININKFEDLEEYKMFKVGSSGRIIEPKPKPAKINKSKVSKKFMIQEEGVNNREINPLPAVPESSPSSTFSRYKNYYKNQSKCPSCSGWFKEAEYNIHIFVCKGKCRKPSSKVLPSENEIVNECDICGLSFIGNEGLRKFKAHLASKTHKDKVLSDKKKNECDICGLSFNGEQGLKGLKVHLGKKGHKEKVLADTKKHMFNSNPLIQQYNRKIIYWNQ